MKLLIFKKMISYILIVMMLMSYSILVNAESTVRINEDLYKTAGGLLLTLGIIDDYDEEDMMMNDVITRSEFVTAIIKALVQNDEYSGGEDIDGLFTDVSKDASYYNALAYAVKLGIISSIKGSEFRPDAPISFNEAAKILVVATGYSINAENSGGYPGGYIVVARNVGISNSVANQNEGFSKGDAITMLYNALTVDIMQQVSYSYNSSKYEARKNENILSEYMDIYKLEGVVVGNCYTRLTRESDIDKDEVEVKDIEGAVSRYKTGETDADNCLGFYIDAFYKLNNSNREKTLIYIMEKNDKNELLFIDGDDVSKCNVPDRQLYYDASVNGSVGEEKYIDIPIDIDIIYNGQYSDDNSEVFNMINNLGTNNIFSVRFLDNDGDSVYNIMFVDIYYNCVVASIHEYNNDLIIVDKITKKSITLKNNEKDSFILVNNSDGERIDSLVPLEEDTVLSIREGKGDKKLYTITISTNSLVGTIGSKTNSEVDSESDKKILIIPDGSDTSGETAQNHEYLVANNIVANVESFAFGNKYRFVFDFTGKIAGCMVFNYEIGGTQVNTYKGKNFGVVVNMDLENALDKRLLIKIYTRANGTSEYEHKIFRTAKNFTIDDIGIDLQDKEVDYRTMIFNKLVTFSLNSNNEIYKINTPSLVREDDTLAYINNDNQVLKYRYEGTNKVFSYNTGGVRTIGIDNNTTIIGIPEVGVLDDREEYFTIRQPEYFVDDVSYDIEGYAFDEDSVTADVILHYKDYNNSRDTMFNGRAFIVNSVLITTNSVGEKATKITGYVNGKEESCTSAEAKLLDFSGKAVEVVPGDVIKCYRDINSNCKYVERLYDYSKKSYDAISSHSDYNGSQVVYIGTIYNTGNQLFSLILSGDAISSKNGLIFSSASPHIYIFDSNRRNNKVEIGKAEDLISYADKSEAVNNTVIITRYSVTREIIIYK